MRVLFASHSYLAAGAERSLVALVVASQARGDKITVAVPRRGPLVELLSEAAPEARLIQVRTGWWMGLRFRGAVGVLRTAWSVLHSIGWLRVIRDEKPDLVIAISTVAPAPILAGWLLKKKVVVFFSESIRSNPTLASALPKSIIIWLLHRWADVTVGVSNFAANQYGGTSIVEHPDVFERLNIGALSIEPDEKDVDGPLKIVMMGTLSREKGQFDAVKAAALLKQWDLCFSLSFYGDSTKADLLALNNAISSLGLETVVAHRGPTMTPLDQLRAADVSLVCSLNEAYGRVTAESILVGTPVVAYAAGASPEILAEGGGVLVGPTPDDMARALYSLGSERAALRNLTIMAESRAARRSGFGDASRTLERCCTYLTAART